MTAETTSAATDPSTKIGRPQQLYTGHSERPWPTGR